MTGPAGVRPLSGSAPLEERVGERRVPVVFELPDQRRAYLQLLVGITEQIADEPGSACLRELNQHHDVGHRVLQRRVNGMPDPLIGEDAPLRLDLDPVDFKGVTLVTDPLRSPMSPPSK